MKQTSKKRISILITLALVISLFAVAAPAASAANAAALEYTINTFDHGGTGKLIASASGNTVTVTGSAIGVWYTLYLEIDTGVTVIWDATYIGSELSYPPVVGAGIWSDDLIKVGGTGVFQVSGDGSIVNERDGHAIITDNKNVTIEINGGKVRATGDYSAIYLNGENNTVIVNSGGAIASGDGAAIYAPLPGADIEMTGGSLENAVGNAIDARANEFKCKVSGGIVSSNGYGAAIYSSGLKATIDLCGGELYGAEGPAIFTIGDFTAVNVSSGLAQATAGNGYAIYNEGVSAVISVSGGTALSTTEKYGCGICVYGEGTAVNVSGGIVRAEGLGGIAINVRDYAKKASVTVSGGDVSVPAEGLAAIIVQDDGCLVEVRGGTVSALSHGAAISAAGSGTQVIVSGGFVFSNASAPVDAFYSVIYMDSGASTPVISGTGVVCAWDRQTEPPKYYEQSSTDLVYLPSAPTGYVVWRIDNVAGIFHKAGTESGFFPVSGVELVQAPPSYPTPEEDYGPPETEPEELHEPDDEIPEPDEPEELHEPDETSPEAMSNFKQVASYTSGVFNDVIESAWYGPVVSLVYEYGLMRGDSVNTFNPTGNLSLAEAITIAARVRSIYMGLGSDADVFPESSPWYKVYVDYAISAGIIAADDFTDYTRAATRAGMAYIFSRALPSEELLPINTVKSLPDMKASDPYYGAVVKLYEAGVVAGSDAVGTFNPNNNITRAEAAAIITRVILPDTRVSDRTFG